MCLKILIGLFLAFTKVESFISDEDYYSMPSLFYLDDYDKCESLKEEFLYCTVTLQLGPTNSTSKVWKIIEEISSNPKHYRHDQLRYGICLSESCPDFFPNISDFKKENEIKSVISSCFNQKFEKKQIEAWVVEIECVTNQPPYPIDNYDISVGICLAILFSVVIFASFYEGTARYKSKEDYDRITKTKIGKLITCFSVPSNWNRLRGQNSSSDSGSLKCINGIRFCNMIGVIGVHTCMLSLATPISNTRFPETMTENVMNILLLNGYYAIQTFFLISGWLLSYNFFLILDKKKKFSFNYIFLAVVHRYIRLTPSLLVLIAINGTWLVHLGSGPFWDKVVGEEYRNCRRSWWINLLYINNYYDVEHICLQHSWYLAADTQLFLVSLIILMSIIKFRKYLKEIFGFCLIISLALPAIINFVFDYDIVLRQYPENLYHILLNVPEFTGTYIPAHTNVGGYFLGLIFGYIFYKYRETKLFTNNYQIVIWWTISLTVPLGVIFAGIPMYDDNFEKSKLGAALYASFSKWLFAFGIGTSILGISKGIGWFARDLVNWVPLQALGRLTYNVYLVHVALIRVRGGLLRNLHYVSHYNLFLQLMGDAVISYIFALILCLFVELPVSALQKFYFPPKKNATILRFGNKVF